MASYPNSIPAFSTPGANLSSPSHSTQHTSVNGEVVAICNTLGTNPQGIEATVKDRLEAIEASIGTSGHQQNTDLGTSNATFYINGITGPYLKGVTGNLQLRNSADAAYVNLTLLNINVQGSITDGVNTVTVAQVNTAVLDDHTHSNKGLLDTYTQTNANIADAVTKKHAQNTDTGTTNETFQMNNGNVNSAKIKVDDLTPTIVDIRNAADSNWADIIAADFRGYLQANNGDTNRPTIKYDESTDHWQLANDGLSFVDIGQGLSIAGSDGYVQYNGTSNLAAKSTFTFTGATDTLSVPNLNLSGNLTNGVQTVTVLQLSNTVANALNKALTSAHIFVGNGSNIATDVAMSGDVTIDNTGSTTVADNSHNHNNTTVTLALNDLTDVIIATPVLDNILRYNGTDWVNGAEAVVNGGSGVDYFPNTTASDIGGYESLDKSPQNVAEQDYTAVCNNNTVLIKSFASPVGGIGGTQIDAGVWTFDIWAYSSLLTLASNIQIEVYKRTTVPVETLLFTITSPTLTGVLDFYSVVSIQQAFAINPTDRLVIKVYGVTANVTNTTVHYAFGGTTHYSHVNTPLVVRHNDLAGLQGGSGGEYYHTTSAQNSALHVAATAGTGINVSGQQVSLQFLGIESLTDPGANTIIGWDDTDNATKFFTIGAGLTYTHATHTLSSSSFIRSTFTNATLSAGVLTITHSMGLSAPYTVMVTIFDDSGKQIIPDEITGSTNSVAVDLTSYGTLSGTWGYMYLA